jgi:hypothetical protein
MSVHTEFSEAGVLWQAGAGRHKESKEMKLSKISTLGALMLGSVAFLATAPASAGTSVSVSIGAVGVAVGDDCDDYYEPPWGYPSDYCNYDVYEEPIYVDGIWYQGPIYWRMDNGIRVFWINGHWRRNMWVGPLPRHWRWGRHGFVRWGGWTHGHKHMWGFGHGHHNWHWHHNGGHGGGGGGGGNHHGGNGGGNHHGGNGGGNHHGHHHNNH